VAWWQAQGEYCDVADQAGGDADEAVSQRGDHGYLGYGAVLDAGDLGSNEPV
jgi:hypothetical protein